MLKDWNNGNLYLPTWVYYADGNTELLRTQEELEDAIKKGAKDTPAAFNLKINDKSVATTIDEKKKKIEEIDKKIKETEKELKVNKCSKCGKEYKHKMHLVTHEKKCKG